ncbi:PREDICTED: raftlin-2 [Chinchilla lanigera]|uniref:raftlin-2 n=1 Tax=Chinchilla lanigera TaxID=34839 RepID=UPI00038EBBC0|nr:PREDICTED: raftlin-2 [Chinchilla lanigera]
MGCGLRKLSDPEDASPGKIFSTLKRPQVETKTDVAYEYVLLDFTLQASSHPELIRIHSVEDIVTEVEDYYLQGYVVGALHPILHPAGPRAPLPASHLYRAVLLRPKASPKHPAAPSTRRHPRLVIEECPVPGDAQTSDIAKELMEKVNAAARGGMRFVGFLPQLCPPTRCCNGTGRGAGAEPAANDSRRSRDEGPGRRPASESGPGEAPRQESGQAQGELDGSPGPTKPRKGEEPRLYAAFNAFEDDAACWSYQEGALSMKVARKGAVISTLDADWLELTTFYYKQGFSLTDAFVCWDSPRGDHLPKSLEGFFIYEEEGSGLPGSPRKGNDAIVVEQWTVIEGTAVKADYGPLLHTLAEFGWLLTSVLPTPVLRHDRDGNLATKQVVFLQRPALCGSAVQTLESEGSPRGRGEDRTAASSRSPGLDTGARSPQEGRSPALGGLSSLCPSPLREGWAKEGSPAQGSSALRELDDGQCDPEDGLMQVTCM